MTDDLESEHILGMNVWEVCLGWIVVEENLDLAANRQRSLLTCWILLALIVLVVDYLSGPFIRFPILYMLPIVLASWMNSLRWGLMFAVVMPLIHLSFTKFWVTPFTMIDATVNTCIRIAVFVSFAYLVNKVGIQKRELEKEIQTLQGILPICSFCKKIRNQDDVWEPLEGYISRRSEAEFSHGVCPECLRSNYPELLNK